MSKISFKSNQIQYKRLICQPTVLLLLWFELIFHVSVYGFSFGLNIVLFTFAALAAGLLLESIISLFPIKVGRFVRAGISTLLAIMYLIEYFIFLQFKVCYDLPTILNGSNDVFNGFVGAILEMIISPAGILRIVLFLAPVVLLWVTASWKKQKFPSDKLSFTPTSVLAVMVAVALVGIVGTVGIIKGNENLNRVYDKEYNFQNAVDYFGLLHAFKIDATKMAAGTDNLEFNSNGEVPVITAMVTPSPTPLPEPTRMPSATATPTPSPTPTPAPQVMDIDFEALAESTSGTTSSLNSYVAGLTPSMTNQYTGLFEGKNLIMITAEAFTAEVIDPELTPTLYRLATQGINFTDSYVPATAGTTGGEFSHITGLLPTAGGSSMTNYTSHSTYLTMGSQLDRLGYYGIMYHNNDYTYYSRHRTHNLLGYSEGFVGYGNGLEDYITSCWPESDLEMMEATVPTYINQQPFNVYYMTVSGHSGYSRNSNAQARKHWDEVENLPYSGRVQAYIGANLELEAALTYLVDQLESAGIADDTVIVICADHFPYGLDNDAPLGRLPYLAELYGMETVNNYFDRDHNRIIIWSGCLEDEDPIVVDTPTTSLDILPTLCNLFGVEWDSRLLPGRDVFSDALPLAFNLNYDWKTDMGTYIANRSEFTPAYEGLEVSDDYISAVSSIVRDKINFCRGVISSGYYSTLYTEEE